MPNPFMAIDLDQPPYSKALLETAKRWIRRGDNEKAVLAAQVACEIHAEQVFAAMFARRGIGFLEESLQDLLPAYNLGIDKVCTLYGALLGDKLQDAPFWPKFKQHIERRNDIVRNGKKASHQEAEESCRAVSELIQHIENVLQAMNL